MPTPYVRHNLLDLKRRIEWSRLNVASVIYMRLCLRILQVDFDQISASWCNVHMGPSDENTTYHGRKHDSDVELKIGL